MRINRSMNWEVDRPKDREVQDLEDICREISETRSLTNAQVNRLRVLFGNRFENAWKVLNENRVKKYIFHPSDRVVWIVVGKERDYHVIPEVNYCGCDDFYFRVVEGLAPLCYHIIAQKLADASSLYELFEESDELYGFLMKEWREFKE